MIIVFGRLNSIGLFFGAMGCKYKRADYNQAHTQCTCVSSTDNIFLEIVNKPSFTDINQRIRQSKPALYDLILWS